MSKTITIVCGPVTGQSPKGRPRWDWRVEQVLDGVKQGRTVSTKVDARKAMHETILARVSEGFTVHARSIDQTGGGDEAVYHSDGSMTGVRKIKPKEGLLGPRCFDMPVTKSAQSKRRAALRPAKTKAAQERARKQGTPGPRVKTPKTPKKPKTPKVKIPKVAAKPKTPKAPRKPKTPKVAGTPALVTSFYAATNQASWIRAHRPIELAQVVRWTNQNGSPADKAALEEARAAVKATEKAKSKSKPKTVNPVTAKPRTAKPVSAKPVSAKPVSAKPVSAKPRSPVKPVSSKPVSSKPVSKPRSQPPAATSDPNADMLMQWMASQKAAVDKALGS